MSEQSEKEKQENTSQQIIPRVAPSFLGSSIAKESLLNTSAFNLQSSTDSIIGFPEVSTEPIGGTAGGELDLRSLQLSEPTAISDISIDISTKSTVDASENVSGSEENRTEMINSSGEVHNSHLLSFSSLQQMNDMKQKTAERIVDFIDEELDQLQEAQKIQISQLLSEQQNIISQVRKQTRDIKRMNERNDLLRQQLTSLHGENTSLRETIMQLETKISAGPENSDVTKILQDIKAKLWGDSVNITPEKKKRIGLLKRLSQTKYNSANEKHCALLKRLWLLHAPTDSSLAEEQWTLLGFETNNPGNELGTTGILGLQNLVYFSERYMALAKARSRTEQYKWALAGISITQLLTSLLHLHGDKGFFSELAPNGIFRTFITLMNHPKAFEELYCVCFMMYDNLAASGSPEPLSKTKSKLKELLLANPKDLHELIQIAKFL